MRAWHLILLLTVSACSDYGLFQGRRGMEVGPTMEVSPLELDFGRASVGDQVVLDVTIANVGLDRLEVRELELPQPFTVFDAQTPFFVEVDDAIEVRVAWTVDLPGAVAAELAVRGNDPELPEERVALTGWGTGPALEITPAAHDFGVGHVGCPDEVQLVLQNVGDEDLVVSGINYINDGQLSLGALPPLPFTLAPGAYNVADVVLSPSLAGQTEARLEVTSNDARGVRVATQQATLRAAGVGQDTLRVPDDPAVDVLFAVDRSCSMEDDAARLADNFGRFIDTVREVTDDWHIGVVTQDDGCLNGPTLTTSTPDYSARFRTAVTTGDDRYIMDDEALFSLVDRALQQTDGTDCNAGFRRADAALHVVVVSDEPEQSPDRSAHMTWSWFVDRWKAEVRVPKLLKVSGVVDLDACADGADGYKQAINATDGVPLSICSLDWGEAATSLAKATLKEAQRVALSDEPVVSSIVITVNGTTWTGTWHYDADAQEVAFETELPRGATVVVDYDLANECG